MLSIARNVLVAAGLGGIRGKIAAFGDALFGTTISVTGVVFALIPVRQFIGPTSISATGES